MKNLISILVFILFAVPVIAQETNPQQTNNPTKDISKHHRIIFQLTTDDSLAHKSLMKQLANITSVAPDTEIEVVCHGPGLNMLVKSKSVVQDRIFLMKKKGIKFVACEFSMRERNVVKEEILPEAGYVKAGIIEIVTKQEQGWSYIKSGF